MPRFALLRCRTRCAVLASAILILPWWCTSEATAARALPSGHVYWTNSARDTIGEANLDGGGVNQRFITGADDPSAIAVDSQHIYWTNASSQSIGRANLDGSDVDQDFIKSAGGARGLAVDDHHIYWASPHELAIGRANLDGSDVEQRFIETTGGPPNSLTVSSQYLYWSDSKTNAVGRANIDGSGIHPNLVRASARRRRGLAVNERNIYWGTDTGLGEAKLDGSAINDNLLNGQTAANAVAVDEQGTNLLDRTEHIYWVDPIANAIGVARTDGSLANPLWITGASDPTGVALSVPSIRVTPAQPPPFPPTPVGSLSSPLIVTVTNVGQRDLLTNGLAWSGGDWHDFVISPDTCRPLKPGESCVLTIWFKPLGAGVRSTDLLIATNDYANSPAIVPLKGTAVPAGRGTRQNELMECGALKATEGKTIGGRLRKVSVIRHVCRVRLVRGFVKLVSRPSIGAAISRGRMFYAVGLGLSRAPGRWYLTLSVLRRLRAGRYSLRLTTWHRGRPGTELMTITIR